MGRKPCCDKVGLKRGPWTIEEDRKLMNFIVNNGIQCWRNVPEMAGLLRCGKSCRLRWINYLRPDVKRGGFTEHEEDQIIHLHETLGNRWSKIASHFEGRTDNEIKNHWNTKIKKRLKSKKISNNLEEEFANKIVQNDYKKDLIDNNNEGDDDDLLKNYEIFNESIEVIERWLNEEAIDDVDGQSSSSSSSAGSFQESFNMSMSELFSPDEYLHQWFDDDKMEPFYEMFSNKLDQEQLRFPEEHEQV